MVVPDAAPDSVLPAALRGLDLGQLEASGPRELVAAIAELASGLQPLRW